jgi:hypothetical protein
MSGNLKYFWDDKFHKNMSNDVDRRGNCCTFSGIILVSAYTGKSLEIVSNPQLHHSIHTTCEYHCPVGNE